MNNNRFRPGRGRSGIDRSRNTTRPNHQVGGQYRGKNQETPQRFNNSPPRTRSRSPDERYDREKEESYSRNYTEYSMRFSPPQRDHEDRYLRDESPDVVYVPTFEPPERDFVERERDYGFQYPNRSSENYPEQFQDRQEQFQDRQEQFQDRREQFQEPVRGEQFQEPIRGEQFRGGRNEQFRDRDEQVQSRNEQVLSRNEQMLSRNEFVGRSEQFQGHNEEYRGNGRNEPQYPQERVEAGPSRYEDNNTYNPINYDHSLSPQRNEDQGFSDPLVFMKDGGHPLLPAFDPEDPNMTARKFIKVLEQVAQEENWTTDEKKMQMGGKLRGAARDWFLKQERLTDTYRSFKRAFLTTFFSDMDYHSTITRMLQRGKLPQESYSNYFAVKTVLLNNCQIKGRKAVSCLIGGLTNDELKNKCYDMNLESAEALYGFLSQQTEQSAPMQPACLMDVETRPPNIPPNVKICYNCKQPGHLANKCPQRLEMYHTEVGINGMMFRAYNDKNSEVCTIRHDQSTIAKLLYNRKKTVVRGHKGSAINTIGEGNILLTVQNTVVSVHIYVVPNTAQDVPVVLGDTLRKHDFLSYHEDADGFHFTEKRFKPAENSSFHANEMLVKQFGSQAASGIGKLMQQQQQQSFMNKGGQKRKKW